MKFYIHFIAIQKCNDFLRNYHSKIFDSLLLETLLVKGYLFYQLLFLDKTKKAV